MQFVSISKACEILDISDTTLYKLLAIGDSKKRKINSVLMGNKRKIEKEELDRFMDEVMKNGGVTIEA